jgi:hypothetical protein
MQNLTKLKPYIMWIEDWEREALKDQIYLIELQKEIEEEYRKLIEPAKIVVIDKDNILKDDNTIQSPSRTFLGNSEQGIFSGFDVPSENG